MSKPTKPTPKICLWTYDVGNDAWDTACGEKHQFMDAGPAENKHTFCPYCGGKLKPGPYYP